MTFGADAIRSMPTDADLRDDGTPFRREPVPGPGWVAALTRCRARSRWRPLRMACREHPAHRGGAQNGEA
jgi:hypothetical protein